ncbi:MAG TPA: hypothetical protein VLI93_17700 [Acetobacteraceae bacterium]|nr:hypothetical protein [Acetobacteraceae bacterium]
MTGRGATLTMQATEGAMQIGVFGDNAAASVSVQEKSRHRMLHEA